MHFAFHIVTRLIFGAEVFTRLGEAVCAYAKKALFITSGSSIKRNSTFERAVVAMTLPLWVYHA